MDDNIHMDTNRRNSFWFSRCIRVVAFAACVTVLFLWLASDGVESASSAAAAAARKDTQRTKEDTLSTRYSHTATRDAKKGKFDLRPRRGGNVEFTGRGDYVHVDAGQKQLVDFMCGGSWTREEENASPPHPESEVTKALHRVSYGTRQPLPDVQFVAMPTLSRMPAATVCAARKDKSDDDSGEQQNNSPYRKYLYESTAPLETHKAMGHSRTKGDELKGRIFHILIVLPTARRPFSSKVSVPLGPNSTLQSADDNVNSNKSSEAGSSSSDSIINQLLNPWSTFRTSLQHSSLFEKQVDVIATSISRTPILESLQVTVTQSLVDEDKQAKYFSSSASTTEGSASKTPIMPSSPHRAAHSIASFRFFSSQQTPRAVLRPSYAVMRRAQRETNPFPFSISHSREGDEHRSDRFSFQLLKKRKLADRAVENNNNDEEVSNKELAAASLRLEPAQLEMPHLVLSSAPSWPEETVTEESIVGKGAGTNNHQQQKEMHIASLSPKVVERSGEAEDEHVAGSRRTQSSLPSATPIFIFTARNFEHLCRMEAVLNDESEAVARYPFRAYEEGAAEVQSDPAVNQEKDNKGLRRTTTAPRATAGLIGWAGSSSTESTKRGKSLVTPRRILLSSCRPPLFLSSAENEKRSLLLDQKQAKETKRVVKMKKQPRDRGREGFSIVPTHISRGGNMVMKGSFWCLDVFSSLLQKTAATTGALVESHQQRRVEFRPNSEGGGEEVTDDDRLANHFRGVFVPYLAGVHSDGFLDTCISSNHGSKIRCPSHKEVSPTNEERLRGVFPFTKDYNHYHHKETKHNDDGLRQQQWDERDSSIATYIPCFVDPRKPPRNGFDVILKTIRASAVLASGGGEQLSPPFSSSNSSSHCNRHKKVSDLIIATNIDPSTFMALLEKEVGVEQKHFAKKRHLRSGNADKEKRKRSGGGENASGEKEHVLRDNHRKDEELCFSFDPFNDTSPFPPCNEGAPSRAADKGVPMIQSQKRSSTFQRLIYPQHLGELVVVQFKYPTVLITGGEKGRDGEKDEQESLSSSPPSSSSPSSSSSPPFTWLALAGYAHFPLISQLGFYDIARYSEDDVSLTLEQYAHWQSLLPLLERKDVHFNFIRYEAAWDDLEVLTTKSVLLRNNDVDNKEEDEGKKLPKVDIRLPPPPRSTPSEEPSLYVSRRLIGHELFKSPKQLPHVFVFSDLQHGMASTLFPIRNVAREHKVTKERRGTEKGLASDNLKSDGERLSQRRSFGVVTLDPKAKSSDGGSLGAQNGRRKSKKEGSQPAHMLRGGEEKETPPFPREDISSVASVAVVETTVEKCEEIQSHVRERKGHYQKKREQSKCFVIAPASHNGFKQPRIYMPMVMMPTHRWQRFFFGAFDRTQKKRDKINEERAKANHKTTEEIMRYGDTAEEEEEESLSARGEDEGENKLKRSRSDAERQHQEYSGYVERQSSSRGNHYAGLDLMFDSQSLRLPWNRPLEPLNTYREDLVYFSNSPLNVYANGGVFTVQRQDDNERVIRPNDDYEVNTSSPNVRPAFQSTSGSSSNYEGNDHKNAGESLPLSLARRSRSEALRRSPHLYGVHPLAAVNHGRNELMNLDYNNNARNSDAAAAGGNRKDESGGKIEASNEINKTYRNHKWALASYFFIPV